MSAPTRANDQADLAVVVGATGALGGTAVRAMLARGLRVVGVARDGDALQALAAEHKRLIPCRADIAELEQIAWAVGLLLAPGPTPCTEASSRSTAVASRSIR
jgi:NADP-dependent 3-hydroxy acid dehydrogenase YdfG